MYRYAVIFFTGLLAGYGQEAIAQAPDETVNKVVARNVPCTTQDILSVQCEKATVHITGWKNNYIQVRITFSATHPDKKIAVKELEYMQYSLSHEQHTIELRNAFILPPSANNIQSRLEVLVELMMPSGNQLSVKDKYGNVVLNRLSGKTSVQIEFCDMHLNNIGGPVELQCSYSEIRGEAIATPAFRCRDETSRFFMDLDHGSYTFSSKHSELDLSIKNILAMNIEAVRTDITIRPLHVDSYYYKLTNKEGPIYAPGQYAQYVKKEGDQSSLSVTGAAAKPLVKLTTSFNTITIK